MLSSKFGGFAGLSAGVWNDELNKELGTADRGPVSGSLVRRKGDDIAERVLDAGLCLKGGRQPRFPAGSGPIRPTAGSTNSTSSSLRDCEAPARALASVHEDHEPRHRRAHHRNGRGLGGEYHGK